MVVAATLSQFRTYAVLRFGGQPRTPRSERELEHGHPYALIHTIVQCVYYEQPTTESPAFPQQRSHGKVVPVSENTSKNQCPSIVKLASFGVNAASAQRG